MLVGSMKCIMFVIMAVRESDLHTIVENIPTTSQRRSWKRA